MSNQLQPDEWTYGTEATNRAPLRTEGGFYGEVRP